MIYEKKGTTCEEQQYWEYISQKEQVLIVSYPLHTTYNIQPSAWEKDIEDFISIAMIGSWLA